jgi:hypothetical protein
MAGSWSSRSGVRVAILGVVLTSLALAPRCLEAQLDPAKAVGPETCAKCHADEYAVWQRTAHAKIFASETPLHRRPQALEIQKNLGIRLIKSDSLCLNCHFTPRRVSGKVTAIAGVSCESCHGAAGPPQGGWLNVHNMFHDQQTHRLSEKPAERQQREDRNFGLGMFAGGHLYDLLSRCYQCHMVPDEHLVNVGGHTAGGDFDLLGRYESIRHNFVSGERAKNVDLTPERKRQYYVLGLALNLEYGLRGIAAASEQGAYVRALVRKVGVAEKRIAALQRKANLPELATLATVADSVKLDPGSRAAAAAAGRASIATRHLLQGSEVARMAAIDSLLEEHAEAPNEPEATARAAGTTSGTPGTPSTPGTPGKAGALAASGTPAATLAVASLESSHPATRGAEGSIHGQIRPPLTSNRVIGQGKCEGCHSKQADWWSQDKHSVAADAFMKQAKKNKQIAFLYYGSPDPQQLLTGKSVCMNCHSTVLTGKESHEVDAGVGCEGCHGPAGTYVSDHPHQSAPERIAGGMTNLASADRRAEVCASCHYITDARLLSSGHPAGTDFDLGTRNGRIKHWKAADPDVGALHAAYAKVLSARGAVPQVRVAKLEGAALPAASERPSPPTLGAAAATVVGTAGVTPSRLAGRSSPASGAPTSALASPGQPALVPGTPAHITLPPAPEHADQLPVDQLLLLIQRRLDALYAQTGGHR